MHTLTARLQVSGRSQLRCNAPEDPSTPEIGQLSESILCGNIFNYSQIEVVEF